jgi:hypothetical protein
LRPSVQAARTRKAVSTSSVGLMVVSDLHLILGLNVCFCTWANSPMVPIHVVRVVDAWHEHRATRRTAQSCRRRPGGGQAVMPLLARLVMVRIIAREGIDGLRNKAYCLTCECP